MPGVLVDQSFLSPQDCTALAEHLRAAAAASDEIFGRLYRTEIAAWLAVDEGAPELRAQLEDIRERARRALAGLYAAGDTPHVEFTLFSEMQVGDSHPLHADHEVTPITRGSRCSLAIWTTLDPEYSEPWGE